MATKSKETMVPLYLPRLEDSDGTGELDQTVPVSMNGETLIIKRGESVQVPLWAFEILHHSGKYGV